MENPQPHYLPINSQISQDSKMEINNDMEENPKAVEHHKLNCNWTIWAHLPHDTDWSIQSYKNIYTMKSVEECIAIMETVPDVLVKNCMLFIMKEGVKPIWEDPKNRSGGCFSYKIVNKNVYEVWRDLAYVVMGGSVSKSQNFVSNVTGITISPKKNFCIIKIWMSNCSNQDPTIVSTDVKGLSSHGCLFKKHVPEY